MKKLFSILFFSILIIHLFATIINIPTDQPTIQEGINNASTGDTVLVQPGIYQEKINFNGKNIVVASLFLTTQDTSYISQTIITYQNYGAIVKFSNGEDSSAILTGFTIKNGVAAKGGGIYCVYSHPTLKNLYITHNFAREVDYAKGGGLYLKNSNATLINLVISDNDSSPIDDYGAAIAGGIYCDNSSLTFINVIIKNNHGYNLGGGIFCSNSTLTVTNSTIANNNTENEGGGLISFNSNITFTNTLIMNNSAGHYGGGLLLSNESNATLSNTTVKNNLARYGGGGIFSGSYSNIIFDSENRSSIYANSITTRGYGSDIFTSNCPLINVIVDTFSVFNPGDYHASPIENFTFDILHSFYNPLINADLYVSPTGDNNNSGLSPQEPLKTITFALSRIYSDSLHPHTIHLASGTYSPGSNNEHFPLSINSFITLEGNSQDNTIINASGSGNVLIMIDSHDIKIKNLTLKNGYSQYGGAIYSVSSTLTLNNINIFNNAANEYGGGIYSSYSDIRLTNVSIRNNHATKGAGMSIFSSTPTLSKVNIISNYAENEAGGLLIYEVPEGIINDAIVSENYSYNLAGAFAIYNSRINLSNTKIRKNYALNGSAGIYFVSSNSIITNTLISDNFSSNGCFSNGITASSSNLFLINVTMVNMADDNEPDLALLYMDYGSNVNIINSIIWENNSSQIFIQSGYIIISYSNIRGGDEAIVINGNPTITWLEGNIDADPVFADTLYHLSENSPCIDTGTPDTTGLYLPIYDLDDNFRIWDGDNDHIAIIDMGAYEFGSSPVYSHNDEITHIPLCELYQNYPNPFNPSTNIDFYLNKPANVKLTIYNLKGQKVKTLITEKMQKGYHSVNWNGTNSENKKVGSGVYLYKIDINGTTQQIKKCVLMK